MLRSSRSPAVITTCFACGLKPEGTMRHGKLKLRGFWVQVHLWLGLTLGVLGIAIGITGSVLVYENDIDAAIDPARYAVTGSEVALPYADYFARAAEVLDNG